MTSKKKASSPLYEAFVDDLRMEPLKEWVVASAEHETQCGSLAAAALDLDDN